MHSRKAMYLRQQEKFCVAFFFAVYILHSSVLVASVGIHQHNNNIGPASWDPNKFLQQLSKIQEQSPVREQPNLRFKKLSSSLKATPAAKVTGVLFFVWGYGSVLILCARARVCLCRFCVASFFVRNSSVRPSVRVLCACVLY